MKAEQVAKLVLTSPEGIVLPYGPSGRLNLPGGGMDPGELPIEALSRELDEELGLPLSELSPVWIGEQTFVTSNSAGQMQLRNWNIFAATTEFLPDELMYGEEIQGVTALPREKLYTAKNANKSAKIATALAHRATLSLRR